MLGLQETKLTDELFPVDELRDAGYDAIGTPGRPPTTASRCSCARVSPRAISSAPSRSSITASGGCSPPRSPTFASSNLYVPNGESVGTDKYRYKLDWLDALHAFLAAELRTYPRLLVMGDFNVAPDERDVCDPARWRIGCCSASRSGGPCGRSWTSG